MVYKCCVYGCKSNYAVRTKASKESKTKVPHVLIFRFPKDEVLRSGGYLIRISKLQKILVLVSSTFIVKMC